MILVLRVSKIKVEDLLHRPEGLPVDAHLFRLVHQGAGRGRSLRRRRAERRAATRRCDEGLAAIDLWPTLLARFEVGAELLEVGPRDAASLQPRGIALRLPITV
jgi:hypothetical protein